MLTMLRNSASILRDTEQYQIAYIIDATSALTKFADIFTRIDSPWHAARHVRLAQRPSSPRTCSYSRRCGVKQHHGLVRRNRQDERIHSSGHVNFTHRLLLAQVSILLVPGRKNPFVILTERGKEILIPDVADFQEALGSVPLTPCSDAAIKLLRQPQEFGAISSNYLPYVRSYRVRCAPGSGKVTSSYAATRCATENSTLVLGFGVHQSLFRLR